MPKHWRLMVFELADPQGFIAVKTMHVAGRVAIHFASVSGVAIWFLGCCSCLRLESSADCLGKSWEALLGECHFECYCAGKTRKRKRTDEKG
jgi:hypothetical protein